MGFNNTRRSKIGWIKNIIQSFFSQKKDGIISRDKLIATFALENNSTERTGKEIIKLLEKTGYIKVNGDEIIYGKRI